MRKKEGKYNEGQPHRTMPERRLCGSGILMVSGWGLLLSFVSCGNDVVRQDISHEISFDTAQLDSLLAKAWDWQQTNRDSCRLYARRAAALARKGKIQSAEAEADCRLGYLEETEGRLTTAISYYRFALALDSLVHHQHGIARDCNHLGIVLKKSGNYTPALHYLQKADSIWSGMSGKAISAAAAKINAGNIYLRTGHPDKALFLFQQALSAAEKQGNSAIQADALNSIGLVYEEQRQLKLALDTYREALAVEEKRSNEKGIATACTNIGNVFYKLGEADHALEWHKRSLELKEKLGLEKSKANTLTNIGLIYQAKSENTRALDYFRESYRIQSSSGDIQETAICANNLGGILRRMHKTDEARQAYEEALHLARTAGSKMVELEVLSNLSSLTAGKGSYAEAFAYTDAGQRLRDTIEMNMRHAAESDALYQKESHRLKLAEKEREKQKVELQRNRAENRRQETLLYALATGVALLLLLVVAVWRGSRERHRAQLAEQQEKINRQQTEELIRNQELQLLRSMLEAREKERQRIAKDLHDRLGLKLSTARLYLNAVDKIADQLPDDVREQYASSCSILDESFNELRKVAHNLADGELIRFGLVDAVKHLCETIEATGKIKIAFYSSGLNNRLDIADEFQLYQVVQELLSNVLRHAEATLVTVQLTRYNHTLNILVEDNGRGFAHQPAEAQKGMGLNNIYERVTLLNGTVQIDSKNGRGTTISIDITTS